MRLTRGTMIVTAVSALAAAAPGLALAQPGFGAAQEVRLPEPGSPLVLDAGRQQISVVLVAGGLVGPWDIEFLPNDEGILVTESPGRLRLIRGGTLQPEPVWEVPPPGGRDVLHGVVAHPDFDENRLVYVSYTKADDSAAAAGASASGQPGASGQRNALLTLAIARGRLENGRLVDTEEIFAADAWETASNATAGRMIFGPDGSLYVSVGDRDRLCCGPNDDNSIRIKAQDLGSHIGKVLRLTDDGGVPDDNPFVGRAGAKSEIFTYGNRNAYGFAFHPETGELWSVEIGPNGGDELNILLPGRNYGWPLVSLGRNYSGTRVSDQPWYRPGMEMPVLHWTPVISPSSLAFYTGDRFPRWKGNLFVTALSGQRVVRLAFNERGLLGRPSPMLTELGVRFRDVEQGPDGYLYFATEVRYGSGNPDGTVLRIEPVESSE